MSRKPSRVIPLPALDAGDPPLARRARGALGAVMRAEWPDPEDIRPSAARSARQVHGWRTYCPLRRMAGHPSSGITPGHIAAADKLRELVDLSRMGHTPGRTQAYAGGSPQPRAGLSPNEMAQAAATRSVRRVLRLYDPRQLAMIHVVLLANQSLRSWIAVCAAGGEHCQPAVEKRRLLAILDLLDEHFAGEIEEEINLGIRLALAPRRAR
jgi:hypothetical protein